MPEAHWNESKNARIAVDQNTTGLLAEFSALIAATAAVAAPPPLSPPPESHDVPELSEEELSPPNQDDEIPAVAAGAGAGTVAAALSRRALRFCTLFITR